MAASDIGNWISSIFQAGYTKIPPTLIAPQTYTISSRDEYIPCTWADAGGTVTVKGAPVPIVGSRFTVALDDTAGGSNFVNIDMTPYLIEDPLARGTYQFVVAASQASTRFAWVWNPNTSQYDNLY